MAELFKFNYTGGENKMEATFDLESGQDIVTQDVTNYVEAAKMERAKQEHYGIHKSGYRKFATIPDIVALKLLTEHQLDVHDPEFMRDENNLKRLKKILLTEYRDLVINT